MLRIFSNLHRGLKLLKQISKTKGQNSLDLVVQDAVINAENLGGKISKLSEANKKRKQEIEKNIKNELLHVKKTIASSEERLDKVFSSEIEGLSKTQKTFIQEISSSQNTISKELGNINHNALDIAEQFKSVRDYLATQSDQVKRLQEGYDWTILKNFATRIIRCVDRLDDDIKRIQDSSCAEQLQLIREELIIALEDSGIEEFYPKLDSVYQGNEGRLKVVSTKSVDLPEESGKVIQVISSGYLYRIDFEKIVVVRPSQVEISVQHVEGENHE